MSRIVIVTPLLPAPNPDNAGERYVLRLLESLRDHDITIIVPRTPRNVSAGKKTHLQGVIMIDVAHSAPASILPAVLRDYAGRMRSVRPHPGFLPGIRRSADALRALAQADVVDFQWEEMGGLHDEIHRLAPHARTIVTLHDVVSQRFERLRASAPSPKLRLKYASNREQARGIERAVCKRAGSVVVFSEKDRALLPSEARVRVVYPDLMDERSVSRDASGTKGGLLFVGPLWRDENFDGVMWFVDEVWPKIRRRAPYTELTIAGGGPAERLARLSSVPGVKALGFVPDLDPLFEEASALIAPLWRGAGVKFKVVDAIGRGLPVIGTSIAFEGIGDATYVPRAADSATVFADQVLSALEGHLDEDAEQARVWAHRRYGSAQFERRVRGLYGTVHRPGIDPGNDSTKDGSWEPSASVVIPVLNGEAGIADQLDSLACEPEASELEVIIADNGSTDGTRQAVAPFAECFGRVRVIDASSCRGVSHARNIGVQAAKSEFVLIVDHDDEVRPGYVAAMLAALSSSDLVGGETRTERLGGGQRQRKTHGHEGELPIALGGIPYAIGASMGLRRSAFLRVGGFDESFRGGHEEADFAWRIHLSGGEVRAAPGAVIDYRQRATLRGSYRQFRRYGATSLQLWARYHATADLVPVSFRGAVGEVVRALVGAPRAARRSERFDVVRGLGWRFGKVEGHLRYRILGTPPHPLLIQGESEAGVAVETRSLKVAFLTPWDPQDDRAWSGAIHRMHAALARVADVEVVCTAPVRTALADRALARVLGMLSSKRYLWDFGLATAAARGRYAARLLDRSDAVVVLAAASSPTVSSLRAEVPIVQVVDATFASVRDFYPIFSNLHPLSAFQAERVARRSTVATTGYLAMTDWAVEHLVHDDGVGRDQCVVAPLGPVIEPAPDETGYRSHDARIRALFVASDWERKGGPGVVEAVRLARERGIEIDLAVAGVAPPLPDWVDVLGRLTSEELSREYLRADVLVELSSATASGVTLTDAAAHGLPVVTTNVGGVASIVEDDVSGLLIPAGRDVVSLAADALVSMTDPRLRDRLGRGARARHEAMLNWDAWAAAALRACESAIRHHQR